MISQYNDIE
jgi:hypothetical protein